MALITCPHCGKAVSDSAEKCIHCGGALREKPEVERKFAALPLEEQKALQAEFEQKFPSYADLAKNSPKYQNLIDMMLIILSLIFIVGGVIIIAKYFTESIGMWAIIVGSLGLIIGVIGVVFCCYRIHKSNEKNLKEALKIEKRFQTWLKDEKNIHYSVELDAKDRKKFEQITLD